jgi:ABC-type molybdenum transport system ATPase subunit/photorepair protein PhrA
MDQVIGLKVILSGYYGSIGTYGYQDYSYAQFSRADGMLEEMGG